MQVHLTCTGFHEPARRRPGPGIVAAAAVRDWPGCDTRATGNGRPPRSWRRSSSAAGPGASPGTAARTRIGSCPTPASTSSGTARSSPSPGPTPDRSCCLPDRVAATPECAFGPERRRQSSGSPPTSCAIVASRSRTCGATARTPSWWTTSRGRPARPRCVDGSKPPSRPDCPGRSASTRSCNASSSR